MASKFLETADDIQLNLYKKFNPKSLLGNQAFVLNFLAWTTLYRRNLHRCATDYLGLKLHLYQKIVLYFLGRSKRTVIIATRSAAKSFIIAIYACCMAILYPGIKIVVVSAILGQSTLIVKEKIKNELWHMSPMLRREIGSERNIGTSKSDCYVQFLNGSTITIVPANDNGRGNRSNVLVREEYRMIAKKNEDSVIAPFQVLYNPPYTKNDQYLNIPTASFMSDIYISSSWIDDGHWMWDIVDNAKNDMFNGENVTLLAFDESIVLKHNIKPMEFLKNEKKKQDPLTWRTEYLNERVKENTSAYFSYSMLSRCQKPYTPFYPRSVEDIRAKRKNPYLKNKEENEIRIISCDIALMSGAENDNSIFTCISAIPETKMMLDENGAPVSKMSDFCRRIDYIYSINGGESESQAITIRRLFEEYRADYIVLDTRSVGIPIYDCLAKPLYDTETGITYKPLVCFNNDKLAQRIKIPGAEPKIYAINASQKLNSDIAIGFKNALINQMIELPVNLNKALEDVLPNVKEYAVAESGDMQYFYESPFLETQAFISEANGLMATMVPGSSLIKISETGKSRKDRYTSISYGSYFVDEELRRNLIEDQQEYEPQIFCS